MNIKNQEGLINELDTYFKDYKKFKMPSFRQSAKNSTFFKNNYSKIYKLLSLKNKNFEQIQKLNDLILISYFSSKNSIKSIKKLNSLNNDKKIINIENLFIRNKKKIYLEI